MTAPEQTAAARLAALDARIAAGERVDGGTYVLVRAEAELETRQDQANDRIRAQQDAMQSKALRRKNIENAEDVLPVAVSAINRKVAEATDAYRAEDAPTRLLYPTGVIAQAADLGTLTGVVLAAIEAGVAPRGTTPCRDLINAARWLLEDTATPWVGRLDVSDEVAAIESVCRPLVAEF